MQAAMSAVTGGVASHAAHAYTEDLYFILFFAWHTQEKLTERERERASCGHFLVSKK
jgi:hypothetical protein